MYELLKETYTRTQKMTGINPVTPTGIRQLCSDRDAFNIYAKGLSEGLVKDDYAGFMVLAENTRVNLLENSMFQINPYESLELPVLRVFYPKLIAKELVNVMPISKPEVIKGFVKASFKRFGETGYPNEFPSDTDISRGDSIGVTAVAECDAANQYDHNVLAVAGFTPDVSHIEKDFAITGVYDSLANFKAVSIRPTVDGTFSEAISFTSGETDVLSGNINFLDGVLNWSTSNGKISKIRYEAFCSLEENVINPKVRFTIEKIRFSVVQRQIQAEWTIPFEQDIKALWDISIQGELVNTIGEQIALDVDKEIINALITMNNNMNPSSHVRSFNLYPPTNFSHGRKQWYENIIPELNTLSAQINNSCLMGSANTLACNPLDAAVFESLNSFEYTGNSVDGGDVGYKSATVQGGKWKILVSSLIPQGTILTKYRSNDLSRAAYVYAPYVPALLMPYPLGANPSMTIMTRYSTKVIRHNAVGILNITDVAPTP